MGKKEKKNIKMIIRRQIRRNREEVEKKEKGKGEDKNGEGYKCGG